MGFAQETRFARDILQKRPRLRWAVLGLMALLVALWLFTLSFAVLGLRLCVAPTIAQLQDNAIRWRFFQLCLALPGSLLTLWYRWRLRLQISHAIGLLPHPIHCYPWRQMLGLSALCLGIRLPILLSVPLCLYLACRCAMVGALHPESVLWLALAIQFVVLAVLLWLLWLYVSMGLWCAPILWLCDPPCALWQTPFLALRIMRGRRRQLLVRMAWYGLQMLPLVTIPWVLPQAAVVYCTWLHIAVRESDLIPAGCPGRASASAS